MKKNTSQTDTLKKLMKTKKNKPIVRLCSQIANPADNARLWQHELWSDAPFLKAVSVALIIARQRHPGNFTQRFILSGLAQMKERH
jgi:hypothetical protein